jgi:hypothetical protein
MLTELSVSPYNTGASSQWAFYGYYWRNVSPGKLARLKQIAGCFQYYAFRSIRIRWETNVPTTIGGNFTVGLTTNALDESDFAAPTAAQIMGMEVAALGNINQPACLESRYNGTKVFETRGQLNYDGIQYKVAGRLEGFADWSASGIMLLRCYVDYVCDFYKCSMYDPNPTLSSEKKEDVTKPESSSKALDLRTNSSTSHDVNEEYIVVRNPQSLRTDTGSKTSDLSLQVSQTLRK